MSAIAIRNSGAVRTAQTQNRRVISTSSGFVSSAAVGTIGSSAMPQIGHEPGASRTISGCIGQVYCVPAASGSRVAGASACGVQLNLMNRRGQIAARIAAEFFGAALGAKENTSAPDARRRRPPAPDRPSSRKQDPSPAIRRVLHQFPPRLCLRVAPSLRVRRGSSSPRS